MYFIDPNSLVRATLASQPRAPKPQRRDRQARGIARGATSITAVPKAGRRRRHWTLVPFRQAFS